MGLYYILYINLYFYLSNITFKKIVKEGTKGGGKRGGRGGEENPGRCKGTKCFRLGGSSPYVSYRAVLCNLHIYYRYSFAYIDYYIKFDL